MYTNNKRAWKSVYMYIENGSANNQQRQRQRDIQQQQQQQWMLENSSDSREEPKEKREQERDKSPGKDMQKANQSTRNMHWNRRNGE